MLAEGVIIGLANHTALISRDGRETAIEDSAAPIRDAAGRITGTVMVFHDVADRRRAEFAMRRSEMLLADFFEQAPIGLEWVDGQGKILRANRSELKLLGFEEQEYVGKRWQDFHVDQATAERALESLVEGEAVPEFKAQLRTKFGVLKDVVISADAFREDGKFVHARFFIRDVTAQIQAEKARAHLAALVTSSDDAIVSKSLTGVIGSWNQGAERLFGYTAAEAIGQPITMLIPTERLAEETNILERLRRGERVEHFETVRKRKNGELFDVSLTVSPIRDDAGKVTGASKIARDITNSKRAQRALSDEYAVVDELNKVARSLVAQLDLERVVQIITDAGTKITRAQFGAFFYNRIDDRGESYTLYTLSGVDRSAFEKFPMPRATHLFGPTFRGEGVIRLDDVRKDSRFGKNAPNHGMPSGHLPVVSYLAVPVFGISGEVLGGLFFGHPQPGVFNERDERLIIAIAAQAAAAMNTAKLYESEKKARAAAESADRTKTEFIAALSHELRTPLTPVLAILSSLRSNTTLPSSIAMELDVARRNVLLEARLIDDLLDISRISTGKLLLHEETTFLEGLIENAVTTCRADMEGREIELIRDLRAPSAAFFGDGARITQVLWNLLKNAIKFTPDGGTVTVRSRLINEKEQPFVETQVEDTGVGIEPERLNGIFSAFEQGGRKVTEKFGGLGLGLAISRAIVQAHHGSLTAASKGAGLGSMFTLRLPLVAAPRQVAVRLESSELPGPDVPLRILLVEDHRDSAAVLQRLLSAWGHKVIHERTVSEALATARKELSRKNLDLVISDLGLPDGSGLNLMRILKTEYSVRGIALSGYGMESDIEQTREVGFVRHLTKPVDPQLLRAALKPSD